MRTLDLRRSRDTAVSQRLYIARRAIWVIKRSYGRYSLTINLFFVRFFVLLLVRKRFFFGSVHTHVAVIIAKPPQELHQRGNDRERAILPLQINGT